MPSLIQIDIDELNLLILKERQGFLTYGFAFSRFHRPSLAVFNAPTKGAYTVHQQLGLLFQITTFYHSNNSSLCHYSVVKNVHLTPNSPPILSLKAIKLYWGVLSTLEIPRSSILMPLSRHHSYKPFSKKTIGLHLL